MDLSYLIDIIFLLRQVSTRFLSASPLLYWFASHIMGSPSIGKRWGHFIWAYSAAYIFIGSLLFSNFYPFTWRGLSFATRTEYWLRLVCIPRLVPSSISTYHLLATLGVSKSYLQSKFGGLYEGRLQLQHWGSFKFHLNIDLCIFSVYYFMIYLENLEKYELWKWDN